METSVLPPVEGLIGVAGAPITLLLTHYALASIPRVPKSAHSLAAVIIGILWNLAAISYLHGDLARAPALGVLSGLSAVGLRHGIVWRERRPPARATSEESNECK